MGWVPLSFAQIAYSLILLRARIIPALPAARNLFLFGFRLGTMIKTEIVVLDARIVAAKLDYPL